MATSVSQVEAAAAKIVTDQAVFETDVATLNAVVNGAENDVVLDTGGGQIPTLRKALTDNEAIALGHANAALGFRDGAETEKDEAVVAKNAAGQFATDADGSKITAAGSASAADGSKTAAAGSATASEGFKNDAEAAATTLTSSVLAISDNTDDIVTNADAIAAGALIMNRYRLDQNGIASTSTQPASDTIYAVTLNSVAATLADLRNFVFIPNVDNVGAGQINITGNGGAALGAKNIVDSAGANIGDGDLVAGSLASAIYLPIADVVMMLGGGSPAVPDVGTFTATLKNDAGQSANNVTYDDGSYLKSNGFMEIWCSHQAVGETALTGSSAVYIDLSLLGEVAASDVRKYGGTIGGGMGGHAGANTTGSLGCEITAGEDKLRLTRSSSTGGSVGYVTGDELNVNPRHDGIHIRFPIA
ncbi:MAG: hypothetical protein HRU29_11680 [Rhizobiales bacterium]|nr:hypothetical protein [Hyphomicrobiales bacterium]